MLNFITYMFKTMLLFWKVSPSIGAFGAPNHVVFLEGFAFNRSVWTPKKGKGVCF